MMHIEQGHEVTLGHNSVEISGVDDGQLKHRIAMLVLERTGRKKTLSGFAAFYWHDLPHGMSFRLSPDSPVSRDDLHREVRAAVALYLGEDTSRP